MDEHRRIRVWTSEKGTRIEIVRSTGKSKPNHIIERVYYPFTEASANRIENIIEDKSPCYLHIHSWGFVGCWFIP